MKEIENNMYYQTGIKTSRNEDSVYAMKYASQQMMIDKLQEENQQLKEQLQQKENIINEITNYCKFQIEKEQDKFPDLLESEKWLKGRISAFVEVLDMECIRDINKYQKDQENNINLLLNKLQQKEDIINKIKQYLRENEKEYGNLEENEKIILRIIDNKGE